MVPVHLGIQVEISLKYRQFFIAINAMNADMVFSGDMLALHAAAGVSFLLPVWQQPVLESAICCRGNICNGPYCQN
jgi:hypothetical protein